MERLDLLVLWDQSTDEVTGDLLGDMIVAFGRAVLDHAWEAVHAERLADPTEEHGDLVYQRAVEDCENAVFALKGP